MAKEYIEERLGGLYVAGTRVSLAAVIFQFQQGASPETILQSFPALASPENVHGAIAYYWRISQPSTGISARKNKLGGFSPRG